MFYAYVKLFFRPLVAIYLRLQTEQKERIPGEGAALVVANHTSFLDPILLGSACPRKLHFIVLQSMYDWWRLRWFYWGMETIPVRTQEADPAAIRKALHRLRQGELVAIFPEGARSEDGALGESKLGTALLAAVSGVPVIPCHIEGAHAAWPPGTWFPVPGRVRVRFGPPLRYARPEERRRNRESLAEFAGQIMNAISELGPGAGE